MPKPLGGSPMGGLTHDGGTSGVSKLRNRKPTDFESQGGQDTGQEAWVVKPLDQTVHGVKPQEARMVGGPVISPWVRSWEQALGKYSGGVSKGGLASGKQSQSSKGQSDLALDGRSQGMAKPSDSMARWGKATGSKPCGHSLKVKQT
jgi:hypothetical protein